MEEVCTIFFKTTGATLEQALCNPQSSQHPNLRKLVIAAIKTLARRGLLESFVSRGHFDAAHSRFGHTLTNIGMAVLEVCKTMTPQQFELVARAVAKCEPLSSPLMHKGTRDRFQYASRAHGSRWT